MLGRADAQGRRADRRYLLYRQEVRPFTDKQIALVQNFAAQAVVAIENTRLLIRIAAIAQQQTATSEVSKSSAARTFDLQIVLDTLNGNSACRLCDAFDAVMLLREDDSVVFGAHHGPIPVDFAQVAAYQSLDCRSLRRRSQADPRARPSGRAD